MDKRRISFTLVTALMATSLAACGGGAQGSESSKQGTSPETKDNPPAVSKPANTGPKEITMYTAGGIVDEKTFDTMYGNAIRKKFPDVTLKYIANGKGSTIADLIAAGTTIDIVFDSIAYSESFRDYGIHMDMTPYIKAKGLDLNKFEPTAIEFQRKIGNGQLHSLPLWTASAGLFYNKDLFDKFGVGYPKDNMTWTEILEIAKKMTRKDGGIQYVGYVTAASSQANTNQLGLKYIDPKTGKAQIDNEDWTKFMQSIVPFFQISGMSWTAENTTIAAMRAMFEKDRTAAMYTNYSGGTPPEDMNWDVVKVPSYEQAPGIGPQSYPAYVSMTTLSKNKELAFDVIHYLVSKEFQLENTKAGRATILNDKDIVKTYGESMAKFKGKNITAMFPDKRAPIGDYTSADTAASSQFASAFTKIILNQKDVNTALREANEAANKTIEEIKQKKAK